MPADDTDEKNIKTIAVLNLLNFTAYNELILA